MIILESRYYTGQELLLCSNQDAASYESARDQGVVFDADSL